MGRDRLAFIRIVRAVAGISLLSLCLCLLADDAQRPTRNAIFNGAFVEGTTGFSVLGPGYKQVALSADKSQLAQTLITELIVASPGMERTFSVYSPYLLQLRPGREYRMVLQMAGEGHFAFGAFEYDGGGHHIGNNYSERYMLSPELQQFSFTYKPSGNATAIRPSIVFLEATDATAVDVRARIRSFELPVPVDEFSDMCKSWPDYAKDDAFADYEGFSEAQLRELEDIATVATVLPPYEPISMDEPGDFTLTTSHVRFGNRVFPDRISVIGRDILARPIELAVEYDDGTQLHLHPARISIRSTDQKGVLRQQFRTGDKEMRVSAEMHYDAFLVYTVSFPETPDASITNATLSIPLLPNAARYISYHKGDVPQAGGFGEWVFGYGPIPEKGERVETRHVVGSAHMGGERANDWQPRIPGDDGLIWEWKRGFLQTVWVGDEERGISLVSMSTEGYSAREDDPIVRLVRSDDEVSLTYSFITRPVPLNKRRKFQFALQIMPPKHVRDDWFHSRYNAVFPGYQEIVDQALAVLEQQLTPEASESKAADETPAYSRAYEVLRTGVSPRIWEPKEHRRYRDIGFFWYALWSEGSRGSGLPVGGCSTPLVGHPERLSKLVKYSELLGHLGLPYFAATHIASEDPAGYYYVEKMDEWTQHPRIPRPPYLRPTCPNSMFSAYIARGIGKLIDEYGIAGVYFDNCAPQLCQNTRHGCGYIDGDGTLQPTLPILGFRKLFMMVRNEFVKRGKEPLILTHAGMYPGLVSFTDVQLDGEGTYGSDHTQMISLGEWRARWIGPNQFGVQQTYLPAFGYGIGPDVDRAQQQVIGTPRLLAMSLLHGTHVWTQYIDLAPVYRAWTVLDELDEPDVAFIPYWKWPAINETLNGDNVYATAYSGKRRLVLVLANLSGTERDIEFPLSEIKAKQPAAGRVADNMHALPVRLEGGMVKCTIGPRDFRLLSFAE